MVNVVVKEFFDSRKEGWIKKNISPNMSESDVVDVTLACEDLYDLNTWLPISAKKSGQMTISTHPCTFSHPSARKNKNDYVSSVIADKGQRNDGFLRSGNVSVEEDALGNAAAMEVYKFLTLLMEDGESLIQHIKRESELASSLLDIQNEEYETLRDGFLEMMSASSETVTSSKIKQVYFPVDANQYHQLSMLTNSGMIFEIRKRIDTIRFSEEAKDARGLKKDQQYSESGFKEIYGITTIGYGGTKPQNISVLNNKNGGKAHLLLSVPPELHKLDVRFPKDNFFKESLFVNNFNEPFNALHKLFNADYNNKNIRDGRDYRLQEIMDLIVSRSWQVRAVSEEQYYDGKQTALREWQRIWLCHDRENDRNTQDEWLEDLLGEITRWIVASYKKIAGNKAVSLSDEEFKHINNVILGNKEAFR
jgi:CRISPR-associated protein Csy1